MNGRPVRATVAVRRARPADVPRLAAALSAAFQDDPGFAWCAPDPVRRRRHGERFFALTLSRSYLPKGEVFVTDDLASAALWAPPGRWQNPGASVLPFLPVLASSTGRYLLRTLRGLSAMEAAHREVTRPHYYLALVGTDPSAQGRGLGSALLEDMLDRCDAEAAPAYLEATSPGNRSLYLRYGFRDLGARRWVGGGPCWWPMWRAPGASGVSEASPVSGSP